MPPSGLRQVWFLRRSRTPRTNPSAVHAHGVCEESSWQLSERNIAFKRHALAGRAADERQPSRHWCH
jgi:hypothetical protein